MAIRPIASGQLARGLAQIARELTADDINLHMEMSDARDGRGIQLERWNEAVLGEVPREQAMLAAANREQVPDQPGLKEIVARQNALAARLDAAGL